VPAASTRLPEPNVASVATNDYSEVN